MGQCVSHDGLYGCNRVFEYKPIYQNIQVRYYHYQLGIKFQRYLKVVNKIIHKTHPEGKICVYVLNGSSDPWGFFNTTNSIIMFEYESNYYICMLDHHGKMGAKKFFYVELQFLKKMPSQKKAEIMMSKFARYKKYPTLYQIRSMC